MKKSFLMKMAFFFLMGTFISFAQEVIIKGKVTDEKNFAISGATCKLKGSKQSTMSDLDGNFVIKATANDQLQISYVGYVTQTIALQGRNSLQVSLVPQSETLNDVVVVGYGTQKKVTNSGAISSIRSKDLEKVPAGRVEQTLQGRVSGVTIAQSSGQPGSASTIRVRGVTTFGDAGNSPLWVVDGVVVDSGGIGFLNQSDIESIEVLKDAASAAIYGTRAATGVILVTTKKGKSGKINVSYNGFIGFASTAKKLSMLNAEQYGQLMNEKAVNDGKSPVFANTKALGQGTNWQDYIFADNATKVSHELSLNGGSDVSKYYVSFGLLDQQGIVMPEISNFNRKNIRLNSTHKISDIFTFGQTLGYAKQVSVGIGNTNNEFGGPLSSAVNMDPVTQAVITDPAVASQSPYTNPNALRDANGNPYGISNYVGQEMSNPLAYVKTRLGNYTFSEDFVGNAYLEAKINSNLKLRTTLGAKLANWGHQAFTPTYYLNAAQNQSTNNLAKSYNKSFSWNIENTLSYNKTIGNHNFIVLLGQGAYVDGIGGGSNITHYDLPVNYYADASFNFDVSPTNRLSNSYEFSQHRLSSLFARVNYDYDERYLFTAIVRRDGSTKFGSNHLYGVFPSFSFGWNIFKEDFWKENNIIDNLKLKASYGKVGNDAIRDNGFRALIGNGYNYAFGDKGVVTTGYANLSLANRDLHWEETTQGNIGFEAKLFQDFNVSVDLYNKKTTGILRPRVIPAYVGVNVAPVANIADMTNSGVEVELKYNKKFGQFNFSAVGSYAYLKNVVNNVDSSSDFIAGDATFQNLAEVTRTQVGYSYNSFYGYKTNGIFQNQAEIDNYKNANGVVIQPNAKPGDFKWVDTDGNGSINGNDKQILGSSIPKHTFGLTLNLDYKNFDFMLFAQGNAGSKIFQGLRRLDIQNANYQTTALNRWTGEGSTNSYPRLTDVDNNGNFGKMSDFYLESGDYIRLKVVQLGYTLPVEWTSRISISKTRLYLSAENLFTITKYTGFDPEIGGSVFGIDKGVYPQARTIMLGATVQF